MLRNTALAGFNRRHWWHPRASLHLDFLNHRYYWGGRERNEQTDFAGWTGVTLNSSGMTSSANRGVRVTASEFGVGSSASMVASYILNSLPSSTDIISEIWDGTSNESARFIHVVTPFQIPRLLAGGVTQATLNYTHDTGVIHAMGMSWATNDVNRALDGVAGAVDSVATMPAAPTELVVGSPTVSVREVIVINGVLTAAELAKATGDYRR